MKKPTAPVERCKYFIQPAELQPFQNTLDCLLSTVSHLQLSQLMAYSQSFWAPGCTSGISEQGCSNLPTASNCHLPNGEFPLHMLCLVLPEGVLKPLRSLVRTPDHRTPRFNLGFPWKTLAGSRSSRHCHCRMTSMSLEVLTIDVITNVLNLHAENPAQTSTQ